MIEQILYLIVATICAVISRVQSGKDNGTFYAKGKFIETGGKEIHPNPTEFKKYILPLYENYHRIETPWWYITYGMVFFFLMAFFRTEHNFFQSFLISFLITMGSSAAGNLRYQGYINVGSGLPFIDPNEKPNSEFAVGKYSKWWKRPFSGNKRKIAQILGILSIIAGLIIGFL